MIRQQAHPRLEPPSTRHSLLEVWEQCHDLTEARGVLLPWGKQSERPFALLLRCFSDPLRFVRTAMVAGLLCG